MSEADRRRILHVDMDAFYASIEQRDDSSLQGKPLVVGGGSNRGVVAAASYESRQYGIHSAMPMREALRRCPDLLRVRPRMAHYKSVSGEIFSIFRSFTPLVEGLSLDEAFLDVTDSIALFGSAVEIARSIKREIFDRTRLTASVGVATNKLVAKIASDLEKPDGLVVVTPENARAVLDPLPVQVIPGIGRKTLARLSERNIRTVSDLRLATDGNLDPIFGRFTQKTRDRASGIDHRPVEPSRRDKSISAEETFDRDLTETSEMDRQLLALTERTAGRIRAKQLHAGTVSVKIRQSDFRTFTRQRALRPPGNGTDQMFHLARGLLHQWLAEHPGAEIRLLGVGGSDLCEAEQRDLFAGDETPRSTHLDATVDNIRDRFGKSSVNRARTLDPGQIR
jgi:DNA polymerase-4